MGKIESIVPSPEDEERNEKFWEDPVKVMHLIDLLFLGAPEDTIYS